MALEIINIGELPNDGTGDPVRVAFEKINYNFNQVQSGNTFSYVSGPEDSVQYKKTNDLQAVAVKGNITLAVGFPARAYTSIGNLATANWVERTLPTNNNINDLTVAGGNFWGVGANGTVVTSADGITWANAITASNVNLNAVIFDSANTLFVTVGDNGSLLTSGNGVTWTTRTTGTSENLHSVALSPNLGYVAVGANGTLIYSSNAIAWTSGNSTVSTTLRDIVYNGNVFTAVGDSGTVISSLNLTSWANRTGSANISVNLNSVSYANVANVLTLVAVGANGQTYKSVDGNAVTWSSIVDPLSSNLNSIVRGTNAFVAVGNTSAVINLADSANTWSNVSLPTRMEGNINFLYDQPNSNLLLNANIIPQANGNIRFGTANNRINTAFFTTSNSSTAIAANLSVTNTAIVANLSVTASAAITTLNVTGLSNLGDIGNVTILGGNNGYFLQTDGSGGLTWAPAGNGGGGNGTPGGSNTQVQYNNAGDFGGDAGFTYNDVTNTLTVNTISSFNHNVSNNISTNTATVIGNFTAGNSTLGNLATANYINVNWDVSANVVYGNYLYGDGSNLTNLPYSSNANYAAYAGEAFSVSGSNVVGDVANANYANFAGNAYAVDGANVSGIVANANYAAFSNVANYVTNPVANANYANYAGNAFSVDGANVVGEVANANYAMHVDVEPVLDNFSYHIVMVANPGDNHLKVDGDDQLQYNPQFGILTSNRVQANIITGNGYFITSINAANIQGTVPYANIANSVAAANVIGTVANANYAAFAGNADFASNVAYANASNTANSANNANVAITVSGNAQPNITSVGNLTSLNVTGALFAATGNFAGNGSFGNLQVVNQIRVGSNIIANVGSNLIAYGNVDFYNATNVSLGAVGNVIITGGSNGYFLRTDGAGNLTWAAVSNGGGGNTSPGGANTQLQFNDAGSFGGSSALVFDKNTNTLTLNGSLITTQFAAFGNISAGNASLGNLVAGNFFQGSGNRLSNIQGANVTGVVANANYAVSANFANVSTDANYANYSNIANVSNLTLFANTANTVVVNAQPNITSVGNLVSLVVDGNFYANNSNVEGNGSYGNLQVVDEIRIGNTFIANFNSNLIAYGNVDFYNATDVNLGEVTELHIAGGSNGYFLRTDGAGNLSWAAVSNGGGGGNATPAGSNTQVQFNDDNVFGASNAFVFNKSANILTITGGIVASSLGITANISAANATLGNLVVANFFQGSGNRLSNIQGANVNGEVALANFATYSISANIANTADIANTATNANFANFSTNSNVAITVSGNAQPNITSVGNLTNLNVTGGVYGASGNFSGNGSFGNLQIVNQIRIGSNLITNVGSNLIAYGAVDFHNATDVNLGEVSELHIAGGSNGYYLQTNGLGNLVWAEVNVAVVTPGGLDTQVQFNDGGNFGGDSGFVYNKISNALTVSGNINAIALISNTITVNGNAFFGNANLGNLAIANFFQGSGNLLSNIQAANISGTIANANYANIAGTAYAVSGANVSGTVANANYANIAGTAYSVNAANVSGIVANANFASIAGTAYSVSGANVSGFVANANFANIATTAYSVAGANVTGIVANANYAAFAGTAYSVNGANVTGTVANANYAAFANVANSANTVAGANVTGTVANANYAAYAGNVTISSQPNITSVGNLVSLNVAGNGIIAGNLTVGGNLTYTNVSTLNVENPIIEMGGGPNGSPLTTNDGKDRGSLMHYYTTLPVDAFMGWDNSNGEFAFGSNVTNANDVITFNTLGNVRASTFIGNLTGNAGNANIANVAYSVSGSNVVGEVANANYATFAGTAYSVSGANVSGTVANANFANIANTAYSVNAANVVGIVANANFASYANYAYSVDGVNVNGYVSFANYSNFAGTAYAVSGSNVSGAVGNANYANFAGTAYSVDGANVSGYVAFANYAAFANVAYSVSGSNVSGAVANADYAANAGQAFSVSAANVVGEVANANYATFSGTAFNVSGANISGIVPNANYAAFSNIAASANSVAGANVVGIVANAEYANTAGSVTFAANAGFANNAGNANFAANATFADNSGNANIANTALLAGSVTTNAQPNITSVGTLSNLSVSNLIQGGNISVTGNIGASSITASGNLTVSNVLRVQPAGSLLVLGGANITGNLNVGLSSNVTLGDVSNIHISGGLNGYVLQTDGAGNLSWTAGGGGGGNGVPGGGNTQVQFNDGGTFGGNAYLTYNKNTQTLTVVGNLVANTTTIGAGLYQFCTSNVFFATTNSAGANQTLFSLPAANIAGIDYQVISNDASGNIRNISKISSIVLGNTVNYNETSTLAINGYIGDFAVNYEAATMFNPAQITLSVSPQSANATVYKMLVTSYYF